MKFKIIILLLLISGLAACTSNNSQTTEEGSKNFIAKSVEQDLSGFFYAKEAKDPVQFLRISHESTNQGHSLLITGSLMSDSLNNESLQQFEWDDEKVVLKKIFGLEIEMTSTIVTVNNTPEFLASTTWITATDQDHIKYRVQWFDKHGNVENEQSGTLVRGPKKAFLNFAKATVAHHQKLGLQNEISIFKNDYGIFNKDFCLKTFGTSCKSLIEIHFLHSDFQGPFQDSQKAKVQNPMPKPSQPPVKTPRQAKPKAPIVPSTPSPAKHLPKTKANPPGYEGTGSYFEKKPENRPAITPKPTGDGSPGYPRVYIEREVDVQKIVDAATVTCENSEECPEDVGLLIGRNGDSVYQCSATYLGNGYFSSNSHCRPSSLPQKHSSQPCDGLLWVKLPQTPTSEAVTLTCENIVFSSEMNQNKDPFESIDSLIFKVKEPVPRTAAAADWDKMPTIGAPAFLWPSDPDEAKNGIHGIIRKKTCNTFDRRDLKDWLNTHDQNYPVTYIRNCSPGAIPGNSGSSIFSGDGKVQSILSHSLQTQTQKFLMASTYACLPLDLNDDRTNPYRMTKGCFLKTKKDLESYYAKKEEQQERSIERDLESFKRRADSRQRIYQERLDAFDKILFLSIGLTLEAQIDLQSLALEQNFFEVSKAALAHANPNLFGAQIQKIFPTLWRESAPLKTKSTEPFWAQIGNQEPVIFDIEAYMSAAKTNLTLQTIYTPRCIAHPKHWKNDYRTDSNFWWSTEAYRSVRLQYPLEYSMIREYFVKYWVLPAGDPLEDPLEASGSMKKYKVPYKIFITISNYENIEPNAVNIPTVGIEFEDHQGNPIEVQGATASRLRSSIEKLQFCSED